MRGEAWVTLGFTAGLVLLALLQPWFWHPMMGLGLILAIPPLIAAALQRRGNGRRQVSGAVLTVPYFVLGAMEWMVTGSTAAGLQVAVCIGVQLLLIAASVRRRKVS